MYPPLLPDSDVVDLRKFPLRHNSPLGWPTRFWPDSPVRSQIIYPDGVPAGNTIYTYLPNEHFEFAWGDYSKVLLERVRGYSDGTAPNIEDFHFRLNPGTRGIAPTWHSIGVIYQGVSNLEELHGMERHPGTERVWELTINSPDNPVFGIGGIEGLPGSCLTLCLRDRSGSTSVDPVNRIEYIWIHDPTGQEPHPAYSPPAHKPFTMYPWFPEDLEDEITIYPSPE